MINALTQMCVILKMVNALSVAKIVIVSQVTTAPKVAASKTVQKIQTVLPSKRAPFQMANVRQQHAKLTKTALIETTLTPFTYVMASPESAMNVDLIIGAL